MNVILFPTAFRSFSNDLRIVHTRIDGNTVLNIFDYRGETICEQYDTRGEDYGHNVTVEHDGEELDFNTVADARKWIDGELDTDHGFDASREWSPIVI